MRAVVQSAYGEPEVLQVQEIETPQPGEGEVLVRVRAFSVNAGDYFTVKGSPWLVRMAVGLTRPKKHTVPGWDVSGVVEASGTGVTGFEPGDEVFGECGRTMAEYVCAKAERFVPKPPAVSFEQAAAVPTAASTALRGIRDMGKVSPGQHVLVVGASGGVGHFAVQVAKMLGAEVTGVCSGVKAEMVRSIGADHVIDYAQEDYTAGGPRYDVILDNAASKSLSENRRALTPDGIYQPNSGHHGVGPILKASIASLFTKRVGRGFLGTPKPEDLVYLAGLLDEGKIAPVVDRVFPFEETADAFRYLAEGRVAGKVVVSVSQ